MSVPEQLLAVTDPAPRLSQAPRHRASWPVVVLISVFAAAGGVALGMEWRRVVKAIDPSYPEKPAMASMAGMEAGAPPPPAGAGAKAVYVSAARQQLIGVRTGIVARQRVEATVRTVGMIAYDETRSAEIHTKVSGWVEQLFVDYVGKPVHRGQALFAVYSPDLLSAQSDYLIGMKARERLASGPIAASKEISDGLVAASRERLKHWDVSDAQIERLEKTGKASRTVTISSPFEGVVLEKSAFAGQYVTPEMTSFKLVDLSTIWVVGQAFEFEAQRLHTGDAIDVEFPYGQADKLEAHVDFIYPEVDPMTRRVRFRATIKNTDGKLKPDTYVTLVWHGEARDQLVIPKEAVIDTGERKYVLVALEDGYFEPRDVHLGPPVGEVYPVVDGVVEGERVVTSAQFLIDSETNLMAAMQNMAASMPGMDMGPTKTKTSGPESAVPATEGMAGMPMPSASATHLDHSPAPPGTARPSSAPPSTPAPARSSNPPPTAPDMPGMPGMPMPATQHDHDTKQ